MGFCLTQVGDTIDTVAEQSWFQSMRKYRAHGISHELHHAPFVKHCQNNDGL